MGICDQSMSLKNDSRDTEHCILAFYACDVYVFPDFKIICLAVITFCGKILQFLAVISYVSAARTNSHLNLYTFLLNAITVLDFN